MDIKIALKKLDENIDYLIWGFATASLLGSLYFSEVKNLTPCLLCWWQRIFMYPLVAIFAVAILRKDNKAVYYAFPLSLIGMVIAFYQSLLQWGLIKESSIISCTLNGNVSCSKASIDWLGFITIPFLSFVAFTAINILIGIRIYILRNTKIND